HRFHSHLVAAEIVGQILLGSSARQYAHAGAVEFFGALYPQLFRDQKTLAVVVIDGNKVNAQLILAGEGPRGVAAQNVDLFGLECGKPGLGRQSHILYLVGIAKYGGGNGPARVNVEPPPYALIIRHPETVEPSIDPDDQVSSSLYRVQGFPGE